MASFRLTIRAEADFDDIGAYTNGMWGLNQATHYLTKLDSTFVALAQNSAMGRNRNDIRPGLQSCACDQHVIFFRRDSQGDVEILRILHYAMDFERHL